MRLAPSLHRHIHVEWCQKEGEYRSAILILVPALKLQIKRLLNTELIWTELLSGKAIPPSPPSGHKCWNLTPWEWKGNWKFFPSRPFHLLLVLCCLEVDQIIFNWLEWVCSERWPHEESPQGPQEMCLPVSYASVGSAPRKFKSSCHKPWKRKCAAKKGWMEETYKGCSWLPHVRCR